MPGTDSIVPRLLNDVAIHPSEEELSADPHLCRFVLVFDREGYSPAFFREMWLNHRIGCISYHKHPAQAWPRDWFREHEVTMPNGETVTMHLAEMGSLVGSGKDALWMREVRKLTDSGHQTSFISTAFELPHTVLAARMFSRWCQENFFRCMMQHFAIDLLQEYGTDAFADAEEVINPAWRELDRSRNSLQNKLRYRRVRFAEMSMHPEGEDDKPRYDKWLRKKAALLEQIQHIEHQLDEEKAKLKKAPKRITWAHLEEKDRSHRLLPGRRRLMDTIRMIAYRAETSWLVYSLVPRWILQQHGVYCRTYLSRKRTSCQVLLISFCTSASTVHPDRLRIVHLGNSSGSLMKLRRNIQAQTCVLCMNSAQVRSEMR